MRPHSNDPEPGESTLVGLLARRAAEHPDRVAYTFLRDGETEAATITYRELDRRAGAIAAAIRDRVPTGARALLLYPSGIEFVTAFLGCLYAGAVAVPAYPPEPARARRTGPRLRAIADDARPQIALTEESLLPAVHDFLAAADSSHPVVRLATDCLPDDPASQCQSDPPDSAAVAFLQYTSGSTSSPKGVVITHGNLMANARMIRRAFGLGERSVCVGWLPLFHDMGLVGNVLATAFVGGHLVLMPPTAFLQRPARWLEAVTRYRATVSGGPDFAYDSCARKIPPAERNGLDLSAWSVAFTGAEPVRPETLDWFSAAFGPCGFRREAFVPCYGLAEATLLVTAGAAAVGPRVIAVDRRALEQCRVSESDAEARPVVYCGGAPYDGRVVVVEPRTATRCPDDRVGEVWVSGDHVATGYWERPAETDAAFRAYQADTGEGPFLRTGDLGFLHDGGLFVTGRLKDLILVRGVNHYPEDLEATAGRSHPALRPAGPRRSPSRRRTKRGWWWRTRSSAGPTAKTSAPCFGPSVGR